MNGHFPFLVQEAQRLADDLRGRRQGEFDASLVGHLSRYVRKSPTKEELDVFLRAFPGSNLGLYTGATRPQAELLCAKVQRLVPQVRAKVPEPDVNRALGFILGWARKLISAEQKKGRG